jgi:hypothetical protein
VNTKRSDERPAAPWASRFGATCWLSALARNGARPLSDPETVQLAVTAARASAGAALNAERDHAFDEQDSDTGDALKALRVAVRSLRSIESRAHRLAKPRSLSEAVAGTPPRCRHWPLLRELERAAAAFEEAFLRARPPPAARGRGQRASAEERAASNRYVAALFARSVGRPGDARELAIAEIALGRARACGDADDFRERCKRWSKVATRLRRAA